jgi:hypothetical protein
MRANGSSLPSADSDVCHSAPRNWLEAQIVEPMEGLKVSGEKSTQAPMTATLDLQAEYLPTEAPPCSTGLLYFGPSEQES